MSGDVARNKKVCACDFSPPRQVDICTLIQLLWGWLILVGKRQASKQATHHTTPHRRLQWQPSTCRTPATLWLFFLLFHPLLFTCHSRVHAQVLSSEAAPPPLGGGVLLASCVAIVQPWRQRHSHKLRRLSQSFSSQLSARDWKVKNWLHHYRKEESYTKVRKIWKGSEGKVATYAEGFRWGKTER